MTEPGIDTTGAMQSRHVRSLVDAHPALEQVCPQAEGESSGLDGRVQPEARSSEEKRGVAPRSDLLGGDGHDRFGLSQFARRTDDLAPGVELRLGRRHAEHGGSAVPGVDALRLAPGPDPAHRILGGAAHSERGGVSRAGAKDRSVGPERLAEPSVATAGAVTADLRLEDKHVEARLQFEQLPRRPEPEIAAADDDHVRARITFQWTGWHDLAGFLEPPAVTGVSHPLGYAGAAGRRATAKLMAISTAAASGTTIVQKRGSPPAAAPIDTIAAESQGETIAPK